MWRAIFEGRLLPRRLNLKTPVFTKMLNKLFCYVRSAYTVKPLTMGEVPMCNIPINVKGTF